MNYVINKNNRMHISGYMGQDITVMSNLFGFDWGNTTAGMRWNSIFSSKFFADFSMVVSSYQFNLRAMWDEQVFFGTHW
jgi:hypothetical protein